MEKSLTAKFQTQTSCDVAVETRFYKLFSFPTFLPGVFARQMLFSMYGKNLFGHFVYLFSLLFISFFSLLIVFFLLQTVVQQVETWLRIFLMRFFLPAG